MKATLVLLLLLVSSLAFGKTTNSCIPEGGESGAPGSPIDKFAMQVSQRMLVVSDTITGTSAWPGKYRRATGDEVNGRDGNMYLNFTADGSEGCREILVDTALLNENGIGKIKFRCRGEGFGESIFQCFNITFDHLADD